jgi:aerobic-type carbon monoxide dehydrogenase small subunit (CoxS/CutS family)
MSRINLVVDGKATVVDADPAMPLLYALRSELGYTSPKFGCGKAQCGACTVHVDGTPTRSCVMPVGAVAGRKITTLAGLGTPERPHPLQKAFVEEQVPQCGYCLSGWVMTAAAFLRDNPRPTDAEIRDAMTGIKCRCGTHMAIMRAIKRAAQAA